MQTRFQLIEKGFDRIGDNCVRRLGRHFYSQCNVRPKTNQEPEPVGF
jgi:hypothetical protein